MHQRLCLAAIAAIFLSIPPAALAAEAEPTKVEKQEALARFAYTWAWPMMNVRARRKVFESVPRPGTAGGLPIAPPNRLSMLHDYVDTAAAGVPCPNQDVVYGMGFLALDKSPVVIQVPDFGDRFWVFQMGDQRTDSIGNLGKMYASKPGFYLIVGPNWKEQTPEGITEVFQSPTNTAYVIPRVFMEDTAEDREAIVPIINQIQLYPLAEFDGKTQVRDWTRLWSYLRAKRFRDSGYMHMSPVHFFERLPALLAEVPPLAGEEKLYAELKNLLDEARKDQDLRKRLREIAVQADKELVDPLFEFSSLGKALSHGWRTIDNGAKFGTDYQTRVAVAKSNIFVNRLNETRYYYQDFDHTGRRLEGGRAYKITFPKDNVPPVKGFWSLTLYNEHHLFFKNDLKRHSLGTKNGDLRFNEDGSLTILIQPSSPESGESNWLPSPKEGKFSLYLRAYWPDEDAISGSWTPPAILPADIESMAVADQEMSSNRQ